MSRGPIKHNTGSPTLYKRLMAWYFVLAKKKVTMSTCCKRKRSSYETGFKLRVIKYAEEHGNRGAEREFSVSEKLVRFWRKQKEVLQSMPKTKRARQCYRLPFPK